MPQFFSESAPMPQNRFISWDKAVFLLSGEKPPYFKGCSGFFRLFRALHVKPMRDVALCQTKTVSHFKRNGTPLNIYPESLPQKAVRQLERVCEPPFAIRIPQAV